MNTDERDGVRLLAALRDVSPAPPRVDLDAARFEARRRIRRRRLTATGGIIAAVTAVAIAVPVTSSAVHRAPTVAPVPAEPTSVTCGTPQTLPLPAGWPDSRFSAADPTGRFIGGGPMTANFDYKLAMWDNGVPHELPSDGTTRQRGITAISSNGTAVGRTFTFLSAGSAASSAWIYRDGRMTGLPVPEAIGSGSSMVRVDAVNNVGLAAGTVDGDTPVVWRTPGADAALLPLPAGWAGYVVGITDNDTVIGSVGPPSARRSDGRGIAWPASGGYRLLPPARFGAADIEGFNPMWVRKNIVAGYAYSGSGSSEKGYLVAYDMATGKYTVLANPPPNTEIESFNARLWWVGAADASATFSKPLVIWTPRTGVHTFYTSPPSIPFDFDGASFINDSGSLVVGGVSKIDPQGRTPTTGQLAVWHCH